MAFQCLLPIYVKENYECSFSQGPTFDLFEVFYSLAMYYQFDFYDKAKMHCGSHERLPSMANLAAILFLLQLNDHFFMSREQDLCL